MEKVGSASEYDVDDLLNVLIYLNLDNIAPEHFDQLLTLGDILWEHGMPKYYIKVVKIFVAFANKGNYKDATRKWILSRLKNESKGIIRWTLSSIDNLDLVDGAINKRIIKLLETEKEFPNEYSPSMIIELCFGLIVKWKILKAIPLLNTLAADVESDNDDKKYLAETAAKVLHTLKNV